MVSFLLSGLGREFRGKNPESVELRRCAIYSWLRLKSSFFFIKCLSRQKMIQSTNATALNCGSTAMVAEAPTLGLNELPPWGKAKLRLLVTIRISEPYPIEVWWLGGLAIPAASRQMGQAVRLAAR